MRTGEGFMKRNILVLVMLVISIVGLEMSCISA